MRWVPEDCGHVLRVPSGAFTPEPDASLVVDGADEIEGEVSDHSHVSCAMSLLQAGLVVREGDIEDPVEAVLDGPMAAHGRRGALGWECDRRDVVAGFESAAVFQFGPGGDANDRRNVEP